MTSDSNSVFEAPWSDMGLGPHAATARTHATSDDGTDSSFLGDAHARYVPPHRRTPHIEMGETVAVPGAEKKPDDMGVDNRHFEKVIIKVPYALTREHITKLSRDWPGFYFQSSGHGNHDHPLAHANTLVASRMLQRMMPAGAAGLDVYGSPKCAENFNRSQQRSNNPKRMGCLVNYNSTSDFIREINKWGPRYTDDVPADTDTVIYVGERTARYMLGTLDQVPTEVLQEYDHLLLFHTLYYVDRETLIRNMIRGGVTRALGLVLRHDKREGTLNHGEQSYVVRGGIVKQTNNATNTTYYHPNISSWVFDATKRWWSAAHPGYGLTWECHYQCQDNWIVEIALVEREKMVLREEENWEELFRVAENTERNMEMRLPDGAVTMLPTDDGVIELRVTSPELYDSLRRRALGKRRTGAEGAKLYSDLCTTAVHLVRPGALFPDLQGLDVDPGCIIDHVVSAFVSDVVNETTLNGAIIGMSPLLAQHAATLGGCSTDPLANCINVIRSGLPVASKLSSAAGIPVAGSILTALDKALNRAMG